MNLLAGIELPIVLTTKVFHKILTFWDSQQFGNHFGT